MLQITQQLIPVKAKGRRPQTKMTPVYLTIHSTGNPNSTAKNEADNVCNNDPDKQTSFHYVVDDKSIYQVIPDNEVAWHAGDGGKGTGNTQSIGIEICEQGDRKKALLNAAELVKELQAKYKISDANVVQHNRWSGKDCPRILRNVNYVKDNLTWSWFQAQCKMVAKTPEEITIENLVKDGLITSPDYWLPVLQGKKQPDPAYIKIIFDKCHEKLK